MNESINRIIKEKLYEEQELDFGVEELSYYLDIGIKSVKEASHIFLKNFGDLSRMYKNTHQNTIDYATKSDIEIEEFIRDFLVETEITFLGEEGSKPENLDGYCWVVDPIDGTLNYGNTLPFSAISVGLTYNQRPIIGIIATPALNNNLYYGISKIGSWKNNKKIEVRKTNSRESVIAYDGVRGDMIDPYIDKIKKSVGRARLLGTTATELALCAEGAFSAVVAPMAEFWDVAAGIAIVEGAGGVVKDFDGLDLIPGKGSIIAGESGIVEEILKSLK
jgi:myo-inositol-1(or 4)-monophosphatase